MISYIQDIRKGTITMSKIDEAAIATQKIILDIVGEKGIDEDEFAKRMGVDDMYKWLDEPLMTYKEFLSACAITKTPATELFKRTKESLSSNKQSDADASDKGDNKEPVLKDEEVDTEKASIPVSGDVLMRWSEILEAVSKNTGKDIDKVRALFNSAPHVINATTIEINAKAHGDKAEKMIDTMIRKAIKDSKVINPETLKITFADA
jgi:hypothetical protein